MAQSLKADLPRVCYGENKSASEAMVEFPTGHTNLYLTEIGEPENMLRIEVAEGMLGELAPIEWGDVDLGKGRPIEITARSRRFELIWDHYVAYVVRNESYWKAEPNEPPMKDQLERRYSSAFLAFLTQTTFADDEYPGPLEHWALSTLNHCVDVVGICPPRIRQIGPEDS